MRKIFLVAFILSAFINNLVFSQPALSDSISGDRALQNTISIYYPMVGENAHLYVGSEYIGYNTRVVGHPYFDTSVMQAGSIHYNGTLYENVPLLYDILNDHVIINKYNQSYRINLVSEKISYFSILADTFIRYVPDSADKGLIDAGFYHRVYSGKSMVLVKRKKILKEDAALTGVAQQLYIKQNSYFVKRGDAYLPVSSKQSLIKLFGEKSKEVRKYLKKNKIDFNSQPEYAIVQSARYYDLLTN